MRFIDRLTAFLSPAFLGTAAAVVGIGAGLNSMFGDSGGGSGPAGYSGPPVYMPQGTRRADNLWMNLLRGGVRDTRGLERNIRPFLSQYLGGMREATPIAQADYSQMADMARAYSALMGQGGRQAYETAMDPQNALYDRTLQRIQDAERAGQSARGIAMSPYAAGLEGDAVRNFNIDWENNLLKRQLAGLSGMQGAFTGSLGFGEAAPQAEIAGAAIPAGTADTYSALVSKGILGPQAAWMSQIIPYMNQGMGAQANAFGQFATGQEMDFRNQQAGLSNIYGGLGALDTMMNQPGSWLNTMWGHTSTMPDGLGYGTIDPSTAPVGYGGI